MGTKFGVLKTPTFGWLVLSIAILPTVGQLHK